MKTLIDKVLSGMFIYYLVLGFGLNFFVSFYGWPIPFFVGWSFAFLGVVSAIYSMVKKN